MEKVPNKYVGIIRIICYILIPICLLVILQSAMSIAYFADQKDDKYINNYFDTEKFANLYKMSIYNNAGRCYTYRKGGYVAVDISDIYGIRELKTDSGEIYYRTYLDNKNFKFLVIDNKTNKAFTNIEQTMKTDTIEEIKQELKGAKYYWNYGKGKVVTNIDKLSLENIKYVYEYEEIEKNFDCTVYTAIDYPLEYHDNYYYSKLEYKIAKIYEDTAAVNIPVSFIIILVCVILITIYAGRKKGKKEISLDILDKVPLEIIVAFVLAISTLAFVICAQISYNTNIFKIVTIFIICCILYVIGIAVYETFIKRIKTRTLFKNTLIYQLFKMLKNVIKNIFNHISLSVKIALTILAFVIATAVLVHSGFLGFVILAGLCIVIFKYSFTRICKFCKVKETLKKLYEGYTEIHLQEDEFEGVLKELCVYINDIAGGFTNAIQNNLKSERMKTELITNVSHDIKTPLTSIINYVDLLKKEEMPNEKAKEYLEILDQKSQRLKRLTEDLVEASKASSGNIKLNMEKLDVKELVKQVSGEFEDKLKEKKLELILSMPEEDSVINADSRYLYRVMENMYSNIVKYALPDSRVYVDILLDKEKVQIQLKNISKDKLNISSEELMQRFVRGEASRNTEGSGLGLSIAQSLTELQNGSFDIYLDGDLFKVTITFERIY